MYTALQCSLLNATVCHGNGKISDAIQLCSPGGPTLFAVPDIGSEGINLYTTGCFYFGMRLQQSLSNGHILIYIYIKAQRCVNFGFVQNVYFPSLND